MTSPAVFCTHVFTSSLKHTIFTLYIRVYKPLFLGKCCMHAYICYETWSHFPIKFGWEGGEIPSCSVVYYLIVLYRFIIHNSKVGKWWDSWGKIYFLTTTNLLCQKPASVYYLFIIGWHYSGARYVVLCGDFEFYMLKNTFSSEVFNNFYLCVKNVIKNPNFWGGFEDFNCP